MPIIKAVSVKLLVLITLLTVTACHPNQIVKESSRSASQAAGKKPEVVKRQNSEPKTERRPLFPSSALEKLISMMPPMPALPSSVQKNIRWNPPVEQPPREADECDARAADPNNPETKGMGVLWDNLNASAAIQACKQAVVLNPNSKRLQYQYGRALRKADRCSEALEWFHKGADQGYAPSQYGIGSLYYNAAKGAMAGVCRHIASYREAVEWFQKSADQGYPGGQYALGRWARGSRQDYHTALAWYQLAAAQGHSESQYSLGWMYEYGKGVPKDDRLATEWYQKTASRGHIKTQWLVTKQSRPFEFQPPALAVSLEELPLNGCGSDVPQSHGDLFFF